MQSSGLEVLLNIPHFKYFAATRNFYTHIDNAGIFSCHIHISDLCHFSGQANLKTIGWEPVSKKPLI